MRDVAQTYLETMGEIPDAENINVQYTANQGEAILTFVLAHSNEERLKEAAAELRNYLVTFKDVFFVRDNQRGEIDELNIQLKPGAQTLGVSLADVSRQIRQSYYGEEVQRLPRQFGDVKVMLRYPESDRESLNRCASSIFEPMMVVSSRWRRWPISRFERRHSKLSDATVSAFLRCMQS